MLAWLSVWSKVQTCHCHSLSLASVKSRLVLPFWYQLTWVVPDKGPLNVCLMHTCSLTVVIKRICNVTSSSSSTDYVNVSNVSESVSILQNFSSKSLLNCKASYLKNNNRWWPFHRSTWNSRHLQLRSGEFTEQSCIASIILLLATTVLKTENRSKSLPQWCYLHFHHIITTTTTTI